LTNLYSYTSFVTVVHCFVVYTTEANGSRLLPLGDPQRISQISISWTTPSSAVV